MHELGHKLVLPISGVKVVNTRMTILFVFLFQGSWEKKIIERVSNASRKRSANQDTPSPKAKRGRPKVNVLSRYPPLRGTGGIDDVAEERNLAALQKEMDRENPRKDIILPLLKETFASRRQHILGDSDDLSVTAILETYKPLSLPFAVSSVLPRYQHFPHNLAIHCGQYVSKCPPYMHRVEK